MQPAFSLPLSRVPWNVFGTFTFKGSTAPSEAAQVREALCFFGWVAQIESVKRRELCWALRLENGEAGGRLHLHPLIVVSSRNLGFFAVPKGARSVASKVWKRLHARNGISTFRRIEGENDIAVIYAVKDLDAGGDVYELAKTGRSSRLILSPGAIRMIGKRGSAGKSYGDVSTLGMVSNRAALTPG